MRSIFVAFCFLLAPCAVAQTPPSPVAEATVRVAGAALNVVDIERARTFYTEVLGLKVAVRVPAQGEVHEYLLSAGGTMGEPLVILTKSATQSPDASRFGRLVLVVPDADAIVKRSTAAGYPALTDPKLAHFVRDPDGFLIELYQMPSR